MVSCQKEIISNPGDYLSVQENEVLKNKIVRYFEGMPKNATYKTKWDTIHNTYYNKKAENE